VSAVWADSNAVLPLSNLTPASVPGASNLDWIGESIAESLREALIRRGAGAVSRDEVVNAYQELRLRPLAELTWGSALKLAGSLGADRVVYGDFSVTPRRGADSLGTIVIRARVAAPRQLRQSDWMEESGSLEDLARLEAHLAWQALRAIDPRLAPPEAEAASLRSTVRLDAEENYIRGLLAGAPEQREKYFREAARLDTRSGRPAFQLGKILLARGDYREAANWFQKVDAGDMHDREAAFLLGVARFRSGDYAAAEEAFRGLSAAAGTPEVYNNLGAAESRQGRTHALDSFGRALEADSADPDYHFNLGYMLWKTGQFEAAADRFRAVLDRDPADQTATLLLGRCLARQGPRRGAAADARLQNLERIKAEYRDRGVSLPAGESAGR
jgi:tetratricopeptide (TPR) repeat protein